MALTPTTDNTVADIVNDVVTGVTTGALQVGEIYAEGQVPFLALPVIKQIFEALCRWLINSIFTVPLKEAFTKLVIDIQTNKENSSCSKAITALQQAMQSGDQGAINKASSDFDKSFKDLVGYDGSANNAT